ncbi:murein biosynthesis integral membrane protein MurJ [Microcella indica]|uniref:murein biosynthesis integral membrane protein MurJ n=1 Tax=Microcella indica TaxID=2750620 RepID=UPI001FE70C30|nr:lipid II flippase MurJ [Microcella indica]
MSETPSPGEPAPEEPTAGAPTEGSSLRRASLMLASGTVVSRLLGFVSAVMLTQTIGALGSGANTFALANQLPNNIYAIIAGGVLSAVLVPQIVRAHSHADGGRAYLNRLITVGLVVFLLAAVIATLAAPALVALYASPADGATGRGFTEQELALATAFAYWCLPQVLFYALYTLFGEVLNARKVFGPFTWAPALNNVVTIGGLLLFGVLFDADVRDAGQWSPDMIAVLGGSATLGVVCQALVLLLFWRRAGLTFRPDFRWRGVGLGATGRAAGWVFAMIVVMQLGGLVQTRVASEAATADDASLMVMRTAWLLFMLPHSVVVVSMVTAYLTRMSARARDGDIAGIREDTRTASILTVLFMALAATGLIALSVPIARIFSAPAVDQIAIVIAAFAVGLVPFSAYFVIQRVLYALDDTPLAFWLQAAHTGFFVAGALACLALPTAWIVPGIGLVTSAAGAFQLVLGASTLSRRIGAFGMRTVWLRVLQSTGAGVLALVVGLLGSGALGAFTSGGFARETIPGAIVTIALVGLLVVIVYGLALWALRVPEATRLARHARERARRRR